MRLSFLFFAATSLALASCASFDNKQGAERFTYVADNETVVVILSAGAAERCISFATRLKVLPSGSPYNSKMIAWLPVDSFAVKSEFPDHQGFLHVLRLRPGKYYIAPHINTPAVQMTEVPTADFSVTAGEVVYLGEFFLTRACGAASPGVEFPPKIGSLGELRDESARDLALLTAKNPSFTNAHIQKRVLKYTGRVCLNSIGLLLTESFQPCQ